MPVEILTQFKAKFGVQILEGYGLYWRRRVRVRGEQEQVLATVGVEEAVVAVLADREVGAALEAEVRLRLHSARLEDPVIDRGELEDVRAGERHLVARLDAAGHEQVRDPIGMAIELRIGLALVTVHQRVAAWVTPGRIFQQHRQIEH